MVRGQRSVRTTLDDPVRERPADLVARRFWAPRPNRLWVVDLTYVKTHSSWVYVAFIVDVFSRLVVSWRTSRSRADLALDALEMALWTRGVRRATQPTHHSDRGAQHLAVRYSERLAEAGVLASVGSRRLVRQCARRIHGPYEAELIHHAEPWQSLDNVELAPLEYID